MWHGEIFLFPYIVQIISCIYFILYTAHFTLYFVHCTLYILLCTLYTVHCTFYFVLCTLYTVHCTFYFVLCPLSTVRCTFYIVHCKVYSVHSSLYIVLCVQLESLRFFTMRKNKIKFYCYLFYDDQRFINPFYTKPQSTKVAIDGRIYSTLIFNER